MLCLLPRTDICLDSWGLGGQQRDWLGGTKSSLTLDLEADGSNFFSWRKTEASLKACVSWGRTVDRLLPTASPAHAVCYQEPREHLHPTPHTPSIILWFLSGMQIYVNKMQIQQSTGSKEPISEHSASGREGTFRDSGIDVASGLTSEGALARDLSGETLMTASGRTVQSYS